MNQSPENKLLNSVEIIASEVADIALLDSPDLVDKREDLLLSGTIDSYGFIQLITFIEKEFNLSLDDEAQFDPRLRSVEGISQFLSESVSS